MARKRLKAKQDREPVLLKVSSAFVLDGDVVRKNDLVEMTDTEARRLLARGKVELATEADVKAAKGGEKAQAPAPAANQGNAQAPANGGQKV